MKSLEKRKYEARRYPYVAERKYRYHYTTNLCNIRKRSYTHTGFRRQIYADIEGRIPRFAGAASGLGLLQTPPLDLKQVEIIKGSTSTLYGGGAIAGLINLISKTPEEKRDLSLHLNGTSGKGLDVSGFYGQRFNKVGTTIFASYNRNWAYDPSDTGFTAIPQFDRYVFNPKLFLYLTEHTQISIGLNAMFEDRLGGDIEYIKGKGDDTHSYFEKNKTQRHSTQLTFGHRFNEKDRLDFKNSVTYFKRNIGVPSYSFEGVQVSTFSELSYTHTNQKQNG